MTSPQGWMRAVAGVGLALGSVLVHAQQKAGAAQSAVPACTAQGNYAPLCGFHGPEDIEVLPDGRHAIVSELPANMKHSDLPGLLLVDLDSHQVRPLPVDVKPETGWGEAACVAPPRNFGTHGIHVARRNDGRLQLLAVNHDERESIEAFEIVGSGQGIRAVWHSCARYSEGTFNDVASTGDGTFVAVVTMSNADGKRPDLVSYMTSGKDTGWVVEWTPAAGFHRLPNSAVPMPGGVQLSPDGRSVYYTSWSGKDIRRYDRAQQKVLQTTHTAYYPDNLSVRADGTLLVAGLDDLASWKECFAAKAAFCRESSTIATVHPQTLQTKDILHLPAGFLSGASVAVQTGRHLVLGSPSGDRILVVSQR